MQLSWSCCKLWHLLACPTELISDPPRTVVSSVAYLIPSPPHSLFCVVLSRPALCRVGNMWWSPDFKGLSFLHLLRSTLFVPLPLLPSPCTVFGGLLVIFSGSQERGQRSMFHRVVLCLLASCLLLPSLSQLLCNAIKGPNTRCFCNSHGIKIELVVAFIIRKLSCRTISQNYHFKK